LKKVYYNKIKKVVDIEKIRKYDYATYAIYNYIPIPVLHYTLCATFINQTDNY